ncbi:hypothetical protein GCM10011581_32830 [Saccharopolyspora subtropica]|uniref:Uncharacterized protein n=1 Tax=Saccharopolyspora thermophila TaxID=89367 RepID=A0A917K1S5_9PSEU|nr:hypothetical protein [Saccharopolyspora subtropica]GGI93158.1 hypothetical protein GCM10011581_32830 [Saccharopolyspora subtropica]
MTTPQQPWPQQPQQFPGGQPQFPPGYAPQYAAPKPRVPGTVSFASVLGLVVPPLSALLSVVSFVIMLTMFSDILSSAFSALAVSGFFTLAAVVCAALWVVFSLRMRGGRNSARITLVVLAAVWLLYDLYSIVIFVLNVAGTFDQFVHVVGSPTVLIGLAQMVLVLVTTVLFLILVSVKPSTEYFRAMAGR